jgi:hypothetical protein
MFIHFGENFQSDKADCNSFVYFVNKKIKKKSK